MISTLYQTRHSFWMYSLHHRLRYGATPRPGAARMFDPFEGFLPFLAMFTAFDRFRSILRIPTSSILILARKVHAQR